MEISMIANAVKLMVEIDYSFPLAVWNMEMFPNDNTIIINHGYHRDAFPRELFPTKASSKTCPAGYPLGSCSGCGRCEW